MFLTICSYFHGHPGSVAGLVDFVGTGCMVWIPMVCGRPFARRLVAGQFHAGGLTQALISILFRGEQSAAVAKVR